MREHLVYIAQGDMGIVKDGKASPLPSQRLKQYERVLRSLEERHAWKTEGAGARFMGQRNPYAGLSEEKGRVTAMAAFDGQLIYASETGDSGGPLQKGPERRRGPGGTIVQRGLLFHRWSGRPGRRDRGVSIAVQRRGPHRAIR